MAEEITALERAGTWDLVPYPPRVRPITCKWVYKVKTRFDDSLERYKSRLVARGFQQEHGRDFYFCCSYDYYSHSSCHGLCSEMVHLSA
jgi:hypothetical protein